MRRWDNTKMNLKEAVWQGVDWIHPAVGRERQQAAVNSVMKHRVPQNVGKAFTSYGTISFSRNTPLRS